MTKKDKGREDVHHFIIVTEWIRMTLFADTYLSISAGNISATL